jgi:hypothetical protein
VPLRSAGVPSFQVLSTSALYRSATGSWEHPESVNGAAISHGEHAVNCLRVIMVRRR